MNPTRLLPILATAALVMQSCGNPTTSDKGKNDEDTATATENVAEPPAVTEIGANGQLPQSSDKLMVIDFNATWCGPCRQFAPHFESVADKYRGQASFYSVDVDQNPALAAQFNIQSIPTVVYIRPDGTTSSTMGYMDAAAFDTAVASRLNAN